MYFFLLFLEQSLSFKDNFIKMFIFDSKCYNIIIPKLILETQILMILVSVFFFFFDEEILLSVVYTIYIFIESLKFEQVALMVSGMGSASFDVFRMVRRTL